MLQTRVQPVPQLPEIASEISGKYYTLEENSNGWQNVAFLFEPGTSSAMVIVNKEDIPEGIGLDNIFRMENGTPKYMMRGRWVDATDLHNRVVAF